MAALAALACLPWLSFLGLCAAHDPADEAARVAEITAAAERAYAGSRFDIVQASLEGGALKVVLDDLDACADGATIRSLTQFVDLAHHRVEGWPDSARPVEGSGEARFFIRFHPAGDWARQKPALYAEKERFLDAARRDVGWGQQAAVLASERFHARYPRESLRAYTIVGYCPDGQSTSLERDSIPFRTADPEGLTNTVAAVAAWYSR